MTTASGRRYGWRPDRPDLRDFYFTAVRANANVANVDLRPQMPPVYDQGQLGSCTANAIAGAVEFERRKQGLTDFVPSRLFIYYNERVIEGDPQSDNGAEIRDGIKSVAAQGACQEADWPYDETKFAVAPPLRCYNLGKQDLVTSYGRVPQTLNGIRSVLVGGHPVVFGFSVYESFESQTVAQSGVVPMPTASESMIGGHAALVVGYDDARQVFIVRNSWGSAWGINGYCLIPYAYLTNSDLAADFWTITMVGQPKLVGITSILKSMNDFEPAFSRVGEVVGKLPSKPLLELPPPSASSGPPA